MTFTSRQSLMRFARWCAVALIVCLQSPAFASAACAKLFRARDTSVRRGQHELAFIELGQGISLKSIDGRTPEFKRITGWDVGCTSYVEVEPGSHKLVLSAKGAIASYNATTGSGVKVSAAHEPCELDAKAGFLYRTDALDVRDQQAVRAADYRREKGRAVVSGLWVMSIYDINSRLDDISKHIKYSDELGLGGLLFPIANDSSYEPFPYDETAIAAMTDQTVLATVANMAGAPQEIRAAAACRLSDPEVLVGVFTKHVQLRTAIAAQTKDEALLARMALIDDYDTVQKKIIDRLTAIEILSNLAQTAPGEELRKRAAKRLQALSKPTQR
jgi:hypothetical protein